MGKYNNFVPKPGKSKAIKPGDTRNDGKPRITNCPERHRQAEMDVSRMRLQGYQRQTIKKHLMDTYGYADSSADDVIDITNRRLHENYEKFKEDVAKTNIKNLLAIQAEAWSKEDYSNALKAVDLLNKMCGQYEEKMKIDATCDSEVEIKFG